MILDERIAAGEVIVLDGAIGSEIDRLGGKMDAAAWCGMANRTHPDTVRRGARVLPRGGGRRDHHQHLRDLPAPSSREPVTATRRSPSTGGRWNSPVKRWTGWHPTRPVAIAGSMSNNVAWLPGTVGADPAYLPSPRQEAANYREMADILAEAGCDLLIMEMMLDVEHAGRVTEAALATGLPVWTGISTSRGPDGRMVGWDQAREEDDGRLPDGFEQAATEPLETIIDALCALGPPGGRHQCTVRCRPPRPASKCFSKDGTARSWPTRKQRVSMPRPVKHEAQYRQRISPHTAAPGSRAAS